MDIIELLDNLGNNKKYNYDKSYPYYIVNKFLSMRSDTIFFVNEMNKYNPPKLLQYDFYFYVLPKKKRYFKYYKYKSEDDIKLICKYFSIREDLAKSYLNWLTQNQIDQIKQHFDTGGIVKKS